MANPIVLPNRGTDLSKALIEKENADAVAAEREKIKKYRDRMTKVVADVNQILIDAEINWQEWGDIIEIFNDRNKTYFGKVLISTINNREYVHTQPRTSTGGEVIQQG